LRYQHKENLINSIRVDIKVRLLLAHVETVICSNNQPGHIASNFKQK